LPGRILFHQRVLQAVSSVSVGEFVSNIIGAVLGKILLLKGEKRFSAQA
jgi:hypothetical protein